LGGPSAYPLESPVQVTPRSWIITIAVTIAFFVYEFFAHVRKPHEPTIGESARWSAFYIGLALVFGVGIGMVSGWDFGGQYFAGYVTEKVLSVDNLFVFLLLMSAFAVPKAYQQKVLMIGIIIDVVFAVDSIPAIYGLTSEAYIVFTANAFALMGLRQLFFLIGGLLERLVYLSQGLAVILGFIGVKLVFHALHVNELPFLNG